MRGVVVAVLMTGLGAGLGGCAGVAGSTSGLTVIGDADGGKIPGAVSPDTTKAAMQMVTAHCAQYGKKAFITRMDSPADGGLMAFQCLDQKAKP